MTKRRPHRHGREQPTRQLSDQRDDARWTTQAGRPAETADDLPDPVSLSGGTGSTGDPHQSVGTLAGNDAAAPGDVGIGGDDMFGENTAGAGVGDTGNINVHGAGTDHAGFGTTDGGASDPLGGATTGVGCTFGTTRGGADVSRGEDVEPDPKQHGAR